MMAMNFDHLKGKTCVITGGGGVLGTSMADALASVGMKVVILDLNPGAAEKLVKQISEKYSVEDRKSVV